MSSVALDRLRANLGDLFVAVDYPGGARAMYGDLLKTEKRNELMSERASLAMRVLEGKVDGLVQAYWRERPDEHILCDHCQDLSARFLRTARDIARADYTREHKQLTAALAVIRRGLLSRGMLVERDAFDPEVLLKRLGDFFSIFDFRQDGA
jgi:hypothetical protein